MLYVHYRRLRRARHRLGESTVRKHFNANTCSPPTKMVGRQCDACVRVWRDDGDPRLELTKLRLGFRYPKP